MILIGAEGLLQTSLASQSHPGPRGRRFSHLVDRERQEPVRQRIDRGADLPAHLRGIRAIIDQAACLLRDLQRRIDRRLPVAGGLDPAREGPGFPLERLQQPATQARLYERDPARGAQHPPRDLTVYHQAHEVGTGSHCCSRPGPRQQRQFAEGLPNPRFVDQSRGVEDLSGPRSDDVERAGGWAVLRKDGDAGFEALAARRARDLRHHAGRQRIARRYGSDEVGGIQQGHRRTRHDAACQPPSPTRPSGASARLSDQ